jgi:hemerythrin superfamily protein
MQAYSTELPVRGYDAVDILTNDHVVLRSLLAELFQATGRQQRIDIFEHLKGALTVHNATEETLVYPALAQVTGRHRESQHLYHDTSEADMLVYEMDTLIKEGEDAGFLAKAAKLQSALIKHMNEEENSAFPHLQEHIEPNQSELLTFAIREFRSTFRYSQAWHAR